MLQQKGTNINMSPEEILVQEINSILDRYKATAC